MVFINNGALEMSNINDVMSRVFVEVFDKTLAVEPSISEHGHELSLREMIQFYYKTAGSGICKDKAAEYTDQYISYLRDSVAKIPGVPINTRFQGFRSTTENRNGN